ncbi:MAG: hypothetical protein CL916_11050 [Deltaproteobacteria bacterium]|nr:hypothetical protein [Deltaproteobacteria bacterium]
MFDNDKTIIISAKDRTIRLQKGGIRLDETQHEAPQGSESELNINLPPDRYEFLGLLGSGGMGHVLRVRDLILNRSIAMKVLHTHHLQNPIEKTRFLEEAQIEAQLQHPGIVSVHEMGILPSGHMYFTMREVRGVSLKSHLGHRDSPTESRIILIQSLLRVCEAVGYAHNRGVVHCDIKPSNIMIGSYGEVWLVDWGIARLIHMKKIEDDPVYLISNAHSFNDDITGTPLYMSPEQANGFNEELQPTSDVYALGIILYQIILGAYPYPKLSINKLLERVQHGELLPFPSDKNEHDLPSALVKICKKALSFNPKDRFQDGQEIASALQRWLDGSQKEEVAFRLIQEGLSHEKESQSLLVNLDHQYQLIQTKIEEIPSHTPEDIFYPIWNQEERLNHKRKEGAKKWRQAEQILLSALNHCPDHPKTNLALALFYFRAHQDPMHAHEKERVLEALEKHTYALPSRHLEKSKLQTYIVGHGFLSLHTKPSGANVVLEEYVQQNRRLIPVSRNNLGTTPLHKVPIPMGSYRLRIMKEGYEDVLYPIEITRLKHWDGIPPNSDSPYPIWLPPKGSILPDECYIPAGYFQYGGDNTIKEQKMEVQWLDGYIIGKYPFSNRQYIALLDHAYDDGIPDVEAIQPMIPVQDGSMFNCYGRDEYGHFVIQEDLDGDLWDIDWPAICLSYDKKCRAIAVYAEQTQLPYSLPSEEQWEKAARGVDGRIFPWGNIFFNTWSHCSTSKEFIHGPSPIGHYPVDCSPYDAYDMAGNVREATTAITEDTYITKGGCWHSSGTYNRTNKRIYHKKGRHLGNLGFRIVRPIPDEPAP